jgi:CRP-like cAMP-binding protein
MENLGALLKGHPFLDSLDDRHIETLVSCASNQVFREGEKLCRQGEEANVFYLLRTGKAALEIHVPQIGGVRIETLEEGDILGWSWLISPYLWHFDATVVEPVRAFVLDGRCLRRKCEEDHHLGYELLKRFASLIEQRLESMRLQVLDIYGKQEVHRRAG